MEDQDLTQLTPEELELEIARRQEEAEEIRVELRGLVAERDRRAALARTQERLAGLSAEERAALAQLIQADSVPPTDSK